MKLLFLLCSIGFTTAIHAQDDLIKSDHYSTVESITYSPPFFGPSQSKWLGSMLLAFGHENSAAGRFSAFREFPLSRGSQPRYGFRKCAFYAGPEVGICLLYPGLFSTSATTGFALGPVTIDNSLTYTAFVFPKQGTIKDFGSWNPKLGIQLGPCWMKAGPCFPIRSTTLLQDSEKELNDRFMMIGNIPYNFEFGFTGRF